ncbi:MAG: hypothetical protein E7627_07590 [Ruminococcaceae bacterium]|nr:hypothetical protein [Oscillospiraceae bacterium]
MSRGFCKKIYHVKNTGSRYFEEAYLVIRGDTSAATLAEEAERIIREAGMCMGTGKEKSQPKISRALFFVLGVFSSSMLIGITALLISLG